MKQRKNCLYQEVHQPPSNDGYAIIYFQLSYSDWCAWKESQCYQDLLQYLDGLEQRNKMMNQKKEHIKEKQ